MHVCNLTTVQNLTVQIVIEFRQQVSQAHSLTEFVVRLELIHTDEIIEQFKLIHTACLLFYLDRCDNF